MCTADNGGGFYSNGFCSATDLVCYYGSFTKCDGSCTDGHCACQNQCVPIPEYTCGSDNTVSTQCVLGANGCYERQGTTCLYGCNPLTGTCIPYNACVGKQCNAGDLWCYDSAGVAKSIDAVCGTISHGDWSANTCSADSTKVIKTQSVTRRGCSSNACFAQADTETQTVATCSNGCQAGKCNTCSPGSSESATCTIGTCDGTMARTCQANGEWSSHGSCQKSNACCEISNCAPIPRYTCESGNVISVDCALTNGCYVKQRTTCLFGCNPLVGTCNPDPCIGKNCPDDCANDIRRTGGHPVATSNTTCECRYDTSEDCNALDSTGDPISYCSANHTERSYQLTSDGTCSGGACSVTTTRTNDQLVNNCLDRCDGDTWVFMRGCTNSHCGSGIQIPCQWGCAQTALGASCNPNPCLGVSCPDMCEVGTAVNKRDGHPVATSNTTCECQYDTIEDCAEREPVCAADHGNGVRLSGFCDPGLSVCSYADFAPCDGNCENGSCACRNICTPGQKECFGFGYRTCQLQSNGCYEWTESVSCDRNYSCAFGECVYNPPPCEFASGQWSTERAVDGDQVDMVIHTNGSCTGTVGIEIWEHESLLPDILVAAGECGVLIASTTSVDWTARYARLPDTIVGNCASLVPRVNPHPMHPPYSRFWTNLFEFCFGPGCIFEPSYYFKVWHEGHEVINTEQQPFLRVSPFYGTLSLDQYLDAVRTRAREEARRDERLAYNACLFSEETITARCREILAKSHVQPVTEHVQEAYQAIGGWFNEGWNTLDPQYGILIAMGCSSCVHQGIENSLESGQFSIEPALMSGLLHNPIGDQDFSYPFSLFGSKACELCSSGVMEIIGNPQLLVADLVVSASKAILTAAVKKTATSLAIEVPEYVYALDANGLGARMTYKVGDDIIDREFIFIEDELGRMLVSEAAYRSPIRLLVGGRAFLLFDALEDGVIAEITALSATGRDFVLRELFESGRFNVYYDALKASNPDIAQTRIVFREAADGVRGSYAPERPVKLNVKFSDGSYRPSPGISEADSVLAAFEHEEGHVFQEMIATRQGYTIRSISEIDTRTSTNHVLEYFNEDHWLRVSLNPDAHKDMLRYNLQRFMGGTSADHAVTQYKAAVEGDYLEQYLLVKVYNLAGPDAADMPAMRTWIRDGFNRRYPDGWDMFTAIAQRVELDSRAFDDLTSTVVGHSDDLRVIIDRYKLNYWGQNRGYSEVLGDDDIFILPPSVDPSILTPSPPEVIPPTSPEEPWRDCRVSFRTNAVDGAYGPDTWVAFDLNADGQLEAFAWSATPDYMSCGGCVPTGTLTPEGYAIWRWPASPYALPEIFIAVDATARCDSNTGCVAYQYAAFRFIDDHTTEAIEVPSANVSPHPEEPFTDNGQESYQNPEQCPFSVESPTPTESQEVSVGTQTCHTLNGFCELGNPSSVRATCLALPCDSPSPQTAEDCDRERRAFIANCAKGGGSGCLCSTTNADISGICLMLGAIAALFIRRRST